MALDWEQGHEARTTTTTDGPGSNVLLCNGDTDIAAAAAVASVRF